MIKRAIQLLCVLFAALVTNVRGLDDNDVLRWSSAGGGWRNMVTNMAYANIFAQAGLFGESSSSFTALSGQSGGSWFAALFFYAEDFYTKVTRSTPEDLGELVQDMMDSNREYISTFYKTKAPIVAPICAVATLLGEAGVPEIDSFCALFLALHGDWAALNQGMLNAISPDIGEDKVSQVKMDRDNRVDPLKSTDMYLQMTMLPNSRVRTFGPLDWVSYVGLEGDDSILSVPMAVQYSVTNDYESYVSSTPDGTDIADMVCYVEASPKTFSFSYWEKNFALTPEDDDDRDTTVDVPPFALEKGNVREPFGGGPPSVTQITAASTAFPGFYSPVAPSTFAQLMKSFIGGGTDEDDERRRLYAEMLLLLDDDDEHRRLFTEMLRLLDDMQQEEREDDVTGTVADPIFTIAYNAPFLDDLAVCSQWPKPCNVQDVRLVDGYASDAPTAALNIGQYQTLQNGDPSKTIKLILTPPNIAGSSNPPIYLMSYFNTTFNEGIEPGDFYWPSDELIIPMRSPQIFADYLDLDLYESMLDSVSDISNDGGLLETLRIDTETIDNPTYMVKGGQRVEILIFQLRSDIPLGVNGVALIDRYTPELVDMAEDIAASSELLLRVQDFLTS